jgi:thioredoxin 1
MIFTEETWFSIRKPHLLTKGTREMSRTADSSCHSTVFVMPVAIFALLTLVGCADAIRAVAPPADTAVKAMVELVVVGESGIAHQEVDFHEFVRTPGKIVIVDFWAHWCGPCRMLAPELEKVAKARPDEVVVLKVNVDEHVELSSHFGIGSIPDLRFFKDGLPAGGVRGFRTAAELLRELPE